MQRPFGQLGTSATCRTLLGCVLGEPERAEELGQQVRRQQDIHAPRWERRHFGDEGVGLVFELGRTLAGVHGKPQELRVREVGQARRQAHEMGGNGGGGRGELRQLGATRQGLSCQFQADFLAAAIEPEMVARRAAAVSARPLRASRAYGTHCRGVKHVTLPVRTGY
eukprot:scaffold35776_cov63-Phaeocystis_antarctica.AAC.2